MANLKKQLEEARATAKAARAKAAKAYKAIREQHGERAGAMAMAGGVGFILGKAEESDLYRKIPEMGPLPREVAVAGALYLVPMKSDRGRRMLDAAAMASIGVAGYKMARKDKLKTAGLYGPEEVFEDGEIGAGPAEGPDEEIHVEV